jgi:hypothetical protein
MSINGNSETMMGAFPSTLSTQWMFSFGPGYNFASRFNGKFSEIIFYNSDKSANKAAIESNMNSYYSVYSPMDSDAQAFITAASITDSTQQSAVNTLVTSLKSAGIWTKMKAIYPFVGGTATSHSYNLKDTTQHQISWYGGVTHNSNGVTSNGINGYGYSPFIPSSGGLTSTNNHIAIYSRTTAAKDYYNAASDTYPAQNAINIWVRRTDNTAGYDSGNWPDDRNTFSNSDGKGYYLGKVNNDTTSKFYKNGTLMSSKSVTPRSLSNVGFYIFTADYFKTSVITNQETAMFHVGLGLSDTEVTTLNTIIQAFQTTLGRQVA